jgi:hypothetical protein
VNVKQLILLLQGYPESAIILLEGDSGYSPLGAISLQAASAPFPDELILHPDMTPD